MTIAMNDKEMQSIRELERFLKRSEGVKFRRKNPEEAYEWIEKILKRFRYQRLKKNEKGVVKRYLEKMSGYGRAQITRLISKECLEGRLKKTVYRRHCFPMKYSDSDIKLLAQTDELHDRLNGVAVKKILGRMYEIFGQREYDNIRKVSAAHIYNLRKSNLYRMSIRDYRPTHKTNQVNIGERRKPEPSGKPGYIRIDSIHQGDTDKQKGVYHINTVDEVTQFEVAGAVEKLTEHYLLPLLEKLIEVYPFNIQEFHADNGSEYINRAVAQLLNKLLIKLTKSRPRHSNDNALVETKNGSVIRKWIGYGFIKQKYASKLNSFYFGCLNEYLNYHRPCAFSTQIQDRKGKIKKIYKPQDYMTPYEKLKSLPKAHCYLKKGISFDMLDKIALRFSDNAMARKVQEVRDALFAQIFKAA